MPSDFLKEKLRSISPGEFEQFVAAVWAHYGYQTAVSEAGRDRGVDIVATREYPYPRKEVIQVKRYGEDNPVSSPDVQQYSALREQEDADLAVVVTSSRFTEDARAVASELGVEIVDADRLVSTVSADDLYHLLAEYAPVTDTVSQRIHLESMADEIVESTWITSPVAVRDSLREIFQSHPSDPTLGVQATLNAFSDNEGWEESTTVRWQGKPSLDAESITDDLLEKPEGYKRGVPTTRNVALRAVISKLLDDQLRTQPADMSTSELANWFVEDLDDDLVPAVDEYPDHARDRAEQTIDTTDSVAVNRLRVAEELEAAYEHDELRY